MIAGINLKVLFFYSVVICGVITVGVFVSPSGRTVLSTSIGSGELAKKNEWCIFRCDSNSYILQAQTTVPSVKNCAEVYNPPATTDDYVRLVNGYKLKVSNEGLGLKGGSSVSVPVTKGGLFKSSFGVKTEYLMYYQCK